MNRSLSLRICFLDNTGQVHGLKETWREESWIMQTIHNGVGAGPSSSDLGEETRLVLRRRLIFTGIACALGAFQILLEAVGQHQGIGQTGLGRFGIIGMVLGV